MAMSTNKSPVLGVEFDKEIRPLIDIIDKLRKLGIEQDINLPTVIVVGDQSSGKSSIIEAISGVELPRGTGIVTRCPLELQLVRSDGGKEWKALLTCQKESIEITNPAEIGRMVKLGQEIVCGNENDISEELLTLRIESPNAPDLTLIDIPGITRIPVRGQSSDVCTKIMNIIQKYVKNKNAVILCVISSNLDLAVNEALSVAKKYDPNKERTIGVLTKPDKADKHQKEDIIKLLRNEKFELKKGYVVVKCRSQEDLDNNLSLVKSLENERQFFEKDDYFCHMKPSHFGIPNLAKKITDELKCIIKKTLPDLKKEIKNGLESCKEDINKLPLSVPVENGDKRIYLNKIINQALAEITLLLKNGKLKDINVYSDWRKYFNEFQNSVTNIQYECLTNNLSENQLMKQVEISRGREFYGFNNYELFEKLASQHVVKYIPQAKRLLENINESTKYHLLQIINDYFKHLPKINQELKELVAKILVQASEQADNHIDMIFDGEKLIFTMDNELMNKLNVEPKCLTESFQSQSQSNMTHNAVNSTNYVFRSPNIQTQSQNLFQPLPNLNNNIQTSGLFGQTSNSNNNIPSSRLFGHTSNLNNQTQTITYSTPFQFQETSSLNNHVQIPDLSQRRENKNKGVNTQFKLQQSEVFSLNENSRILHNILKSYLKIVQSRLCDILPITIRQWIHIKLLKVVNNDCLKYANDPLTCPKIDETPDVKTYREKLMTKCNRLMEADRKIDQFCMNYQL